MNAIAEVNIPHPTGRVEHLAARRAAEACVAREVAFAVVGFDLRDQMRLAGAAATAHEKFSEQPPRERNGLLRAQLFRFDYAAHPS